MLGSMRGAEVRFFFVQLGGWYHLRPFHLWLKASKIWYVLVSIRLYSSVANLKVLNWQKHSSASDYVGCLICSLSLKFETILNCNIDE